MRFVGLTILLTLCGSGEPERESVRVDRVTDGDTIVVRSAGGAERVRLFGIDAPEMNYGRGRPECWAREAAAALRSRLDGREVRLQRLGRDDYGRTLALVFDSGETSVNEWLLREGHAELFRKARHRDRRRFARAEKEAKERERGMWRCR